MFNKIETIVAKGEIAHHEQFLLWPIYFLRQIRLQVGKGLHTINYALAHMESRSDSQGIFFSFNPFPHADMF